MVPCCRSLEQPNFKGTFFPEFVNFPATPNIKYVFFIQRKNALPESDRELVSDFFHVPREAEICPRKVTGLTDTDICVKTALCLLPP